MRACPTRMAGRIGGARPPPSGGTLCSLCGKPILRPQDGTLHHDPPVADGGNALHGDRTRLQRLARRPARRRTKRTPPRRGQARAAGASASSACTLQPLPEGVAGCDHAERRPARPTSSTRTAPSPASRPGNVGREATGGAGRIGGDAPAAVPGSDDVVSLSILGDVVSSGHSDHARGSSRAG